MSHYSQLFGQVFVVVFLAVLFSIVLFGTPLSLNLEDVREGMKTKTSLLPV